MIEVRILVLANKPEEGLSIMLRDHGRLRDKACKVQFRERGEQAGQEWGPWEDVQIEYAS